MVGASIDGQQRPGLLLGQPIGKQSVHEWHILHPCDLERTVAGQETSGQDLDGRSQMDEEVGRWHQAAQPAIEALAQLILRSAQVSAPMKQLRENEEILVEPAIDDTGSGDGAQSRFLFGAQQHVIHLVGERMARQVGGEEGLERPLRVLLKAGNKLPRGA